ncbi:hypothetical protein LRS13_12850 [Svornostia abyssi]|uniref:Uncharacterized protein n=1 Tax=Svornostia abyssi TaxID=2898438 RepID=A0ABY5PAB3_9ACTN|nr:hypothetical protein LRS13_12850 [Parviterribacteraceae bacterium J379]
MRDSASRASSGNVAAPTAAATPAPASMARIFCTTVSAASGPVSGASTQNSSPPCRPTVSCSRTTVRSVSAAVQSSSSPAA